MAVRVLIAPDKFKGSLSAGRACEALAAGLEHAVPNIEIDRCPIADGGEGTLDAAIAAGFERVELDAEGPTGEPVVAAYGRRGDAAVIELAAASGLHRLPRGQPAPLTASSTGAGRLLAAALDAGSRSIILGIGGSASTDGGAGLLHALGAKLTDRHGRELPPGGAALRQLHRLELGGLHPALTSAEIVVACDVENPLLGPTGAAAVYAPQKGASPEDVDVLEAGLTRWADVVAATTGHDHRHDPGAGAAGGVGFAVLALLDATLKSGIEVILELVDFTTRLQGSDLVITGEGSLDRQTLNGKGPLGVAAAARRHGLPTVAVAGRITLAPDQLRAAGIQAAYALDSIAPDPAHSMAHASRLLQHLAATRLAGYLQAHGNRDGAGRVDAARSPAGDPTAASAARRFT